MMKKETGTHQMKRFITYIILLICLTVHIDAQSYKNKLDSLVATYRVGRANNSFDNLAYAKAIKKYEKLNEANYLSDSIKGQLGIAYLKVSESVKSENTFASINTDQLSNDQLFMYAQSLKYNGKYAEADRMIALYNKRNPEDGRAIELLNSLPKVEKILAEERYLIEEVNFNSEESDFGPFVYDGDIYFVSARDLDYIIKREYAWKETPYLNILKVSEKQGLLSSPKLFSSEMRSMYHDGPICFSNDGNELFITRNINHDFINANFKKNKGYNNLIILHSKKQIDGTWSKPEELPFNGSNYSCGHACLSTDGNRLYFASNMPGSIGGTDIYYVDKKGDSWSAPVNLGNDINTEGDEMFPFITKDGRLYFASNGHVGVGGLDIFIAEKKGEGYQIKNMGSPVNSEKDDFGVFISKDGKQGYFSSNREGGKGDDDIYQFTVLKEVQFSRGLLAKLINKNTKATISNSAVKIETANGDLLSETISDNEGNVKTELEDQSSITVSVNLPDFFPYKQTFNLDDDTNEIVLELVPRPFWGIYGSVFLLPDHKVIPEVTLEIEPENAETYSVVSDKAGNFKTKLAEDTNYQLVFTKKGYFTKRIEYSTAYRDTGYVNVNEFMQLEMQKAEIGESIEIEILYDLGKWNIREDAATELDDMIQFLKDNPTIKIELGSHTDSRGSAKYNQTLSQKRAESAVQYMINRGIDANRIVAKGYGETRLKNRCADGVNCSEEEHQANRRSEVTIIAM
nr:OmpA family protein [uncultured Carboxylicivirga sp.]